VDTGQNQRPAELATAFFVGQYRHALDPKRRMTIPADWRAMVGGSPQVFVIPAVEARHLYVFPARALAPRLQRVHDISMADPEGRNYLRIMGARSELLTWDSQGRIRVRDELLTYAGVTTEAVLVGNWEGFEIWNPDAWARVEASVGEAELKKATKYVGM
jgi:MraZ protein